MKNTLERFVFIKIYINILVPVVVVSIGLVVSFVISAISKFISICVKSSWSTFRHISCSISKSVSICSSFLENGEIDFSQFFEFFSSSNVARVSFVFFSAIYSIFEKFRSAFFSQLILRFHNFGRLLFFEIFEI